MANVLIVAYGNPLRSDDGLASRAARELEGKFPDTRVEILSQHQLVPELAETVSLFECVIFIDAAFPQSPQSGRPGELRVREITSAEVDRRARSSHVLSPDVVVALAAELYHAQVKAFSVTVTGQNFEHGDSLSPAVAAAIPLLTERVSALVRQALSN